MMPLDENVSVSGRIYWTGAQAEKLEKEEQVQCQACSSCPRHVPEFETTTLASVLT